LILTDIRKDLVKISLNIFRPDLWIFSISIYTSVIFIVDIKLAVATQYWTRLSILGKENL